MTFEHEFYPHVEDRMGIKDTDKLGIRQFSFVIVCSQYKEFNSLFNMSHENLLLLE